MNADFAVAFLREPSGVYDAATARFACHLLAAGRPAVASALQASLLRSAYLGLK
ncbi:hypothetical protein ACFL6U_19095 [Planctomycetota bacterium]